MSFIPQLRTFEWLDLARPIPLTEKKGKLFEFLDLASRDKCSICEMDSTVKKIITHHRVGLQQHRFHQECINQQLSMKDICPLCPINIREQVKRFARLGETDRLLHCLKNEGTKEDLEAALIEATVYGRRATLQALINQLPISISALGNTVVEAAEFGQTECLAILLQFGSIEQQYHEVAMSEAAQEGHIGCLKLLLENGAISDEDRGRIVEQTAMFAPLEKGAVCIRLLLESGAIPQQSREMAVKVCASMGKIACLRHLLANDAVISDDARGKGVEVATMFIPQENGTECILLLLENGAIPQQSREIAVKICAKNGNVDRLHHLLANGAVISEEARGISVNLASAYAPEKGGTACVRLLLKKGTILQTTRQIAALNCARTGKMECLRFLLATGDISNDTRIDILDCLARKDKIEGIECFQAVLASGNISEQGRGKVVNRAAKNGHVEFVRILLMNGPISEENRNFAIELAKGNEEMLKALSDRPHL